MNAVFIQHAVDRMRAQGLKAVAVNRLMQQVEHVVQDRETLTHSDDVVRLGILRGEETFIVWAGDMRVVLGVTGDHPEQVVVVGVYRADEALPAFEPASRN
ncbi:hypothetical protein SAMN05216360_10599 [Methylobacterium phyllostachyos]|uniref:DUF4258 domain-containing protein n=1 Tax=Methylobacterium phyllostachyos TaxID=582672 RepID=A0A1G9XYY8_9HYPH|nr:hypothetical protein [Methylobacterium phyllostachyos]SDN02072.1 hypothetical protein SAMN05216360_10599 [Methylobacterium phyllostachyos]